MRQWLLYWHSCLSPPPDSWPLPHKQIKPTHDHSGAGLPSPAENDDTHFSLCIPWWPCQAATNRTCPGYSKSRHQPGSWLMDSWSLLPPAPPHPQPRLAQRKSGARPLDLDLEVEAPGRPCLCPTPRLRGELCLQVLRCLLKGSQTRPEPPAGLRCQDLTGHRTPKRP